MFQSQIQTTCKWILFTIFQEYHIYISIPGKLSEIHLNVLLLYNPGEKVLKSIKSRGQICTILLTRKRTFPQGLDNNPAKMVFWKWISINANICGITGKVSESHLHVWLLFNPRGKVLVIVGFSFYLDLRVQLNVSCPY